MKKPLLISLSLLSVWLISGIYAQTTGATWSLVNKMSALAHSFTLSATLNPGETGLQSAPVKGKKTWDILTAGEWNRVLELMSEGGSGGGSGWVDVPLTDTNPFDHNGCQYRAKITGPAYNTGAGFSADGYYYSDYVTTGVLMLDSGIFIKSGTKNIVYVMDQSNGAIVEVTTAWGWRPTKIEKLCGGGSGGSSSTGNGEMIMSEMSPTAYVNLIDAVNYCRNLTENGITNWKFPSYGDLVNFIDPKYSQDMVWVANFDGTQTASHHINKDYFGSIRMSDGYWSVSTLADNSNKVRCVAQTGGGSGGGASSSGGGATIVEWGIIKTSPKTISNWDLITLEWSWNSGGGDAAPTGGYIYKLGGQVKLAYVEASGINKDIILTTTAQNVHNLTVKLSGDSVVIDPSSTNTLAYLVWKLSGSSGSSVSSSWVDVPLTDTAGFDDSCMYRYQITYTSGGREPYVPKETYYYANGVSPTQLVWWVESNSTHHIAASSKNVYRINGTPFTTEGVSVTKIEKLCGGGSSGGGSIRPSSIDSSDRWPATFLTAFNQCKSEGKYLPTAEEALYFVFGGAGTFQNPSSNPLWTISPDDARDTFVTVYSGFDGLDHTGALSTPYSTTATAHYRCITGGGGSSSSSGWSDISLTGATPFDVNCEYRFKASAPGNTDDDAFIGDDNAYNYIQRVHANRLTYQHIGTSYEHINADTKTTLRQNGTPTSPAQTITQIQKRCN